MLRESGNTNGTDDRGATEVLCRDHLSGELRMPLQLHLVVQVVDG